MISAVCIVYEYIAVCSKYYLNECSSLQFLLIDVYASDNSVKWPVNG